MLQTKINLLVVEQAGDCHKVIEENFKKPRFFVFVVRRLSEATGFLQKARPDLVYLSSDISGALLDIAKMFASGGLPVMIMHQKPTKELVFEALQCGVIDVLVHPFDCKRVLERTHRALVRLGKALPEKRELKLDFGVSKTPREKVELLLGKAGELLALPFSVARVVQLCNSPTASAADLVQPIRSDPSLTSMILRRANSVVFGGREPCASIQQAVVRIGIRETRNISATFSVFELFSMESMTFGFNRYWFWLHSLSVAAAAQFFARLFKMRQPEDAFLSGLLHDLGKMVLDDFMNQEFQKAIAKAWSESIPIRQAELAMFEIDHAQVGASLAAQWKLPDFVCAAIAGHHQYEKLAALEKPDLSAIVCLADMTAKAMLSGHGGDFIIEQGAAQVGKYFPTDLNWPEAVRTIRREVVEQIQALQIASDFFKLSPLPERDQPVAIVAPEPSPYLHLLQIVFATMGLPFRINASADDARLLEFKPLLCIGDFMAATDRNQVATGLFKLGGAAEKHYALSRFPDIEPRLPLPFNAYAFEKQCRAELGIDASEEIPQ